MFSWTGKNEGGKNIFYLTYDEKEVWNSKLKFDYPKFYDIIEGILRKEGEKLSYLHNLDLGGLDISDYLPNRDTSIDDLRSVVINDTKLIYENNINLDFIDYIVDKLNKDMKEYREKIMNYFEEKGWKQHAIEVLEEFQVQYTVHTDKIECAVLTNYKRNAIEFLRTISKLDTCVITNSRGIGNIFVLDIVEEIRVDINTSLTREKSEKIIDRIVKSLISKRDLYNRRVIG